MGRSWPCAVRRWSPSDQTCGTTFSGHVATNVETLTEGFQLPIPLNSH